MGVLDGGWTTAPYMALYVIGFISVCCSSFVVHSILRSSPLKITMTRLVLYLHLTLIWEDVVSMPYAFAGNQGLCQSMAFFWTYTSLSRILIVACLVVLYRNFLFEESFPTLTGIVHRWSEWIVFVLPALPAVTPFTTNSFGGDGKWCAIIIGPKSDLMALIALYSWAWILLVWTFYVLMQTLIRVYKVDKEMTSKLVGSVGMYVVVALLSWIPRTEARLYRSIAHRDYTGFYVDTLVLYCQGLVYCLVFLSSRTSLSKFEDFTENVQFKFSEETRGSSGSALGGQGGGAAGATTTRASKSFFYNPFYRGSSVSDRSRSVDDGGGQIKVTLVVNPINGDRVNSNNSSSGKVVFEGLDNL